MVVDDLHVRRSLFGPHEADTPLVVDTNRVLAGPVALQRRAGYRSSCSHLSRLRGGKAEADGAGRTGLTSVTECGAICRASTTRGPGTIRGSEPTGQSQFGQREATLTIKTTATAPPPPLLLYRRNGHYVELHLVSRVTPLSCRGVADNARTMTVWTESNTMDSPSSNRMRVESNYGVIGRAEDGHARNGPPGRRPSFVLRRSQA